MDRFLESVSLILRNFNFRGMSWPDFLKTRPYLDEFSRNRSMSRSGIHQKLFFNYLLCFGLVFQKSARVMPRKFPNKG